MTGQDMTKMSVQDIALLREIVKWRRANGVRFFQWRGRLSAFTEWGREEGGRRKYVSFDPGGPFRDPRLDVTSDYRSESVQAIPARTVTEAVAVLVALGYLPARFSSAYRAGWDAGRTYQSAAAGGHGFAPGMLTLLPAVELAR